jgi:hypothetical protein
MRDVRSERGRIIGQTTDPVNDIRHCQDWPGPGGYASGGPRFGKEQIMDSREARLLEQYTSLEYILLGDLRDILEEALDRESRRWLIAVLDALLETLPREFDLEETDGYMSEVLERYPNWSGQVDRLHRDHDLLFCKLKELRGRIDGDTWVAPFANEVRRDLRDWILKLIAHRRNETRLVQTAMNLEVGTGD